MNIGEPAKHEKNPPPAPSDDQAQDSQDEARRIRRLQIMMSMVSSVISQDPSLTIEEASELAAALYGAIFNRTVLVSSPASAEMTHPFRIAPRPH